MSSLRPRAHRTDRGCSREWASLLENECVAHTQAVPPTLQHDASASYVMEGYPQMKVALCQLHSPDTLAESVFVHVRAVEQGAEAKCELALFPELSLTGYCMTEAESLTIDPASPLLDSLAEVSRAKSIDIAVGAPLSAECGGVEIGVIVFRPDGKRLRLRKEHSPFG